MLFISIFFVYMIVNFSLFFNENVPKMSFQWVKHRVIIVGILIYAKIINIFKLPKISQP